MQHRQQPALDGGGLEHLLGGEQHGHLGLERVDLLVGQVAPRRAGRAHPAQVGVPARRGERLGQRAARRAQDARDRRPRAPATTVARWAMGGRRRPDGGGGGRGERGLVGGARRRRRARPRPSIRGSGPASSMRTTTTSPGRGAVGQGERRPQADQVERRQVGLHRQLAGGEVGVADAGGELDAPRAPGRRRPGGRRGGAARAGRRPVRGGRRPPGRASGSTPALRARRPATRPSAVPAASRPSADSAMRPMRPMDSGGGGRDPPPRAGIITPVPHRARTRRPAS